MVKIDYFSTPMELDYNLFIENLKGRRYDEALKEPFLTEGFMSSEYGDSIRYALESMVEIDVAYAYKVYNNSRRIHESFHKELKRRNIEVEYRYQGALKTFTNIQLYGDVEIIVIKKNPSGKPHIDVQQLTKELLDILKKDETLGGIDYSDKTRIRVKALKPTCEIDVLPSVWVSSAEYKKTKNEVYRGIAEFDFGNKKARKYLPFLNIARINARDNHVGGNMTALARLLLSLRKDSEDKIDLTDSEINGLLYAIPEEKLKVEKTHLISLLPVLEEYLNKLSTDDTAFNSVISPSGKERIFAGKVQKKDALEKLHKILYTLLDDIRSSLAEKGLSCSDEIKYDGLTS